MKRQDIDYIKKICEEKHSKQIWATRAQVMAKNIKPLKLAAGDDSSETNKIPFEALEEFVEATARKYDMSLGYILTITDVDGNTTYHDGVTTSAIDDTEKKFKHLFTVHGDTVYELYIKLALMMLVTVKEGNVGLRKERSANGS
jgi:hypothetical protein